MAVSYQIKCEHCGTEFLHIAGEDYGTLCMCVGCENHIETDAAIRCPSCMHRLNSTEEEFERQVKTTMFWD